MVGYEFYVIVEGEEFFVNGMDELIVIFLWEVGVFD